MRRCIFGLRKNILTVALLFLPVFLLEWGSVDAWGATPAWKVKWEKTIHAANKEGRVVLYASESYDAVSREFQRKYPKIKVVAVLGRGSQNSQRVMAERRAGKYLADIYLGGSGTPYAVFYKGKILDPVKPTLILPEVLDESKWWSGKHIYHDNVSQYILAFHGVTQSYFSYNTKLVKPNEFKSYEDFLKPKWKGKIVSYDPKMGGAVTGLLQFFYRNPMLGPDFLRRFLSEMDLTATRDSRQLVDWLAKGKFAIAWAGVIRTGIYEAKMQGLPVGIFDPLNFKEGVPLSTSSGNIALFNRTPHPNAAKVFINWLLSREGQMVSQKVDPEKDSLRIDIPKEDVLPHVRRKKGVNYTILAGPGFKNMAPINRLVNQVWKRKK